MKAFRTATKAELDMVLNWAADEGWNPGLGDADAFFGADPNGFFVALDGNRPVAAISVVNHTPDFAFLGLYIVAPAFRGKGVGLGLWQHALQHAGARTIGLDGVPAQQANYQASGFARAGGTTRFSGHIAPDTKATLRLAQPDDFATLIDRETRASGVRKEAYLSNWFANTPDRKTCVTDKGFCTVRRCREGAKIGPLVAETPEAARDLMATASRLFGPDLVIDVPETSQDLTSVCQGFDMTAGFETARMYRGEPPVSTHPNYAVTSLELG